MHNIVVWFQQHLFITIGIIYVLNVMIDQLPAPTTTSSAFYKWFFAVCQVLGANLVRAQKAATDKLGQLPPPSPGAKPMEQAPPKVK